MAEINTSFSAELSKYGAFDFNACYNCGTCTGICDLATAGNSFPRELIRMSVLGLKSELRTSLKPWLCYYCGDCSIHCPRDAKPGELMMSLRRWLTAQYDWTRLSGLLYRSLPATVSYFILVALAIILYALSCNFEKEPLMRAGHLFEMTAIGAVFAFILLPNIARMWWFTVISTGNKIKPAVYAIRFRELLLHMFTQKNSLKCDESPVRWAEHLILVLAYLGLLLTTVFLDWFSSSSLAVIILGYIESIAILVITIDFILSRLKKEKEINRYSQPSDWIFVLWLSGMGISAFTVRLFIDTGLLSNNIWIYILHLIILAQWALVIVPFGKWTHFLYRSFAIYFSSVMEK